MKRSIPGLLIAACLALLPAHAAAERVAVAAALDPQNVDNTSATSDYADLSAFGRVAFVVSAGAIDAATTVDAALYEATDSAGTGAHDRSTQPRA